MSRASATSETLQGFTFEQLDDAAKARARDWWRRLAGEDSWWDGVYDDAIQTFAHLGFSVDEEDLSFRGFWSQGDGASFGGWYIPPKGKTHVASITEYAPEDETLKAIAEELDVIQTVAALKWNAHWRFRVYRMGHGVHSGCMQVSELGVYDAQGRHCETEEDYYDVGEKFEALARRLADWHYGQLEKEYEYLNSDEAIDEALGNGAGYLFNELGHII